MALDKNKVPIALAQGIDTKTDPKQLPPGKLTVLENGIFLKSGEVRKCNGYSETTVAANDDINTISTLKNNVVYFDKDDCYSYSTSLQKTDRVGRFANFKIEKLNAINQNAQSQQTAYDPTNKVLLHVWISEGFLNWSAIDARDNSIIFTQENYESASTQCAVCTSALMDYFLIAVGKFDGTFFDLKILAVSKSDFQVLWSTVLTPLTEWFAQGTLFVYASDFPYVMYTASVTGIGGDTRVAKFSNTYSPFVAPTILTINGLLSNYGGSLIKFQGNLMIVASGLFVAKTIVYNMDLTSLVNPIRTVTTAVGADTYWNLATGYDGNYIRIFISVTKSSNITLANMPRIITCMVDGTSTIEAQRDFLLNAGLAGTCFEIQDAEINIVTRNYVPVKMAQNLNPSVSTIEGIYTNYLIEYNNSAYPNVTQFNDFIAAKFYDLNATSIARTPYGGINYFVPGEYKGAPCIFALIREYAGNASLCIISRNVKPVTAELANNLHVTGGFLGMFDGAQFSEHGFLQDPLPVELADAGSGSIISGTYYYCITWQWLDASGQLHESSPSSPVAISSSGSKQINVTFATLKITNKIDKVYVAIYRSNDGVLFYKVPFTGVKVFNSLTSVSNGLANDKTVNTLTFLDDVAQADIISEPLLYTVGGELFNSKAPACSYISTYKRRLILTPSEDANTFWFSKDVIPATAGAIGTPVSFAQEFVKPVDERGGEITASVQLDDKLLIFKQDAISVMVGEGPANNGLQDDFTTPQLIVTDTGCLYGRSIVIMPLGVMFQSPKGWYLCDRSLSVSYLGASVQNFNSLECTSANLMQDRNEVWFGCTGANVLVFNYYFDQWSNIKNPSNDSVVHQARWLAVNSNKILRETPGTYLKNNAGYSLKFTTGWLSLAQVQGFQRVYKLLLLGEYKTTHLLQVQVAFDFDDTIVQTSTITASTNTPPYEWRVFLNRQKCTAVKFTIQDLSPISGTWDEAYSLSNMALEIGVKKGLNKRPAANSVG